MNKYAIEVLIVLTTFAISIALIMSSLITHKRKGEIIKTSDGKYYKLEETIVKEGYKFIEIDTSEINKLK